MNEILVCICFLIEMFQYDSLIAFYDVLCEGDRSKIIFLSLGVDVFLTGMMLDVFFYTYCFLNPPYVSFHRTVLVSSHESKNL